jgi:hypothetical protein
MLEPILGQSNANLEKGRAWADTVTRWLAIMCGDTNRGRLEVQSIPEPVSKARLEYRQTERLTATLQH